LDVELGSCSNCRYSLGHHRPFGLLVACSTAAGEVQYDQAEDRVSYSREKAAAEHRPRRISVGTLLGKPRHTMLFGNAVGLRVRACMGEALAEIRGFRADSIVLLLSAVA